MTTRELEIATGYLKQARKYLIDYDSLAFPYSAHMMTELLRREALWERIGVTAKLIATLKYRCKL